MKAKRLVLQRVRGVCQNLVEGRTIYLSDQKYTLNTVGLTLGRITPVYQLTWKSNDRDPMVVGFTTNCAIIDYHH